MQEVEPFNYSGLGQDAAGWWPISPGPDILQLSQSCHNRDITGSLFWGKCSLSGSTCDEEMQPDGRTQSLPQQHLIVPSVAGKRDASVFCVGSIITNLSWHFPAFLLLCLPLPSPLLPSKNKARFCSRNFFQKLNTSATKMKRIYWCLLW